jgi:hypothetical protein
VCNNPRKEVTSITNHHESLKSVIFPFVHHWDYEDFKGNGQIHA